MENSLIIIFMLLLAFAVYFLPSLIAQRHLHTKCISAVVVSGLGHRPGMEPYRRARGHPITARNPDMIAPFSAGLTAHFPDMTGARQAPASTALPHK